MLSTRALIRWVIAEVVGTAILAMSVALMTTQTSTISASSSFISLFVPFGVGLTLFLLVAMFSQVSRAHFNPLVTVGHMLFRKIDLSEGGVMILSQIIGAWFGVLLAHILLGSAHVNPVSSPTSGVVLGEFLGGFLLSFTVMQVTLKKIDSSVAAFAIGASLALGVMLAMGQGGGLINPALAIGFGADHWVYLFIPLLGGVCGSALSIILDEEKDSSNRFK